MKDDNTTIGDLREKFGKLQGGVEAWMQNDKEQHTIIFTYIEEIKDKISNIEINLTELKTSIDNLKNNVLDVLQKGIGIQFFEFIKTPRGGLAVIIILILLSSFYLGVDKVFNFVEVILTKK